MSNPYIQLVITCAGPNCGKTKLSTNHWLICHITDYFLIKPWDDDAIREEDNVLPLCGDSCVMKMVSAYLTKMKEQEGKSG